MIIRRYIASQILLTTAAVASVLTVILMSGRVIRYFGMAAAGRMDVSLLTAVLVYRLPQFLELIIPLGMFISILLVFGRLYIDNEMAVLSASGVSRRQVVGMVALPAVIIMLLVGATSLYITPAGNAASDELFAEQAKRNTFDLVKPGRFQRAGERMLYAESLSKDKTQLLGVFLYEQKPSADGKAPRQVLVYAERGRRYADPQTHLQYLELVNGKRYEVEAGARNYSEINFARYRARLPQQDIVQGGSAATPYTTSQIVRRVGSDPAARAELAWRISMPMVVPIVALLAFSLSKVNPRQGRYLKLLPAILLYLSYVVIIVAARNGIEKGKLSLLAAAGVHLFYLVLALLIFNWDGLMVSWRRYRETAA